MSELIERFTDTKSDSGASSWGSLHDEAYQLKGTEKYMGALKVVRELPLSGDRLQPGVYQNAEGRFTITQQMASQAEATVSLFKSKHGSPHSLVDLGRAAIESNPITAPNKVGALKEATFRPPFLTPEYYQSRLTWDSRLNPEGLNFEKKLMDRLLLDKREVLSLRDLADLALQVTRQPDGSYDKPLAKLLLANFSKNVCSILRQDTQYGAFVSLDANPQAPYPRNVYSNEQVRSLFHRLQIPGEKEGTTPYQSYGRLYHFFGAMWAESFKLGNVGVALEAKGRITRGDIYDPLQTGYGYLGANVGGRT